MSQSRKKILSIITHLDLGGAESVALTVAEGLAQDFDTEFFIVRDQPLTDVGRDMLLRLKQRGSTFHIGTKRPFKKGGVVEAAWRLGKIIASVQPHLIHTHTEIPELSLALALALSRKRPQIPVLRTIHNSKLWNNWAWVGIFVERVLEQATIAAVSAAALKAEQDFRARARLRPLAVDQYFLIYNGVAKPGKVAQFPRDPLQILFAGRLEAQKGADLIPSILQKAASCAPARVIFTLSGHGSMASRLVKELQGLPWEVRVTPAIVNLASSITEFDAVLMPSRFEGLGLVAVEAKLAGVPVIATNAPGLVEVVPADDPLSAEVDDIEAISGRLIDFLQSPARFHVEALGKINDAQSKFSISTMIDAYKCTYNRMINSINSRF